MKIELTYNDEGDLMVIYPNGKTQYYYCDYNLPKELTQLIDSIPRYSYEPEN